MIAVPLSLGLNRIGESNSLLATVLLIGSIAAAVWLCAQLASMLKQKDPQFIVIDEIVGFLLANFLAPFSFAALLWSFALFRFFDISKIFPADRLEQLPGGAGIVLDDVMAGVYTFVSLRLLLKMGWVGGWLALDLTTIPFIDANHSPTICTVGDRSATIEEPQERPG